MKLIKDMQQIAATRFGKIVFCFALLMCLVAIPLSAGAGFFPDRPTFDYNKGSDSSNCSNPNSEAANGGRCGSMSGPVFNSFINTPFYGDERSFFDAHNADQITSGSSKDPLTLDQSGSVVMRIYIHNDANPSTNKDGTGIAKGTTVKVELPANTGTSLRSVASISASNSKPKVVMDTLDLKSTQNVTLQYQPGSAILYNDAPFKSGTKVDDSIVSSGAQIGYDSLNGNLPGCFKYQTIIELTVKVIPQQVTPPVAPTPTPQPGIKLTKEVRRAGETPWHKEVSAKPGETVQWLLTTQNTGQAQLTNVVARDSLPPNVQLVGGTVRTINTAENKVQPDQPLFGNGLNLETYSPGNGRYVMFDTQVLDNFSECQKRVQNVAFLKSDQTPTELSDTADLVINKDCVPAAPAVTAVVTPPPAPRNLPNTGTDDIVGLFATVVLIGAAGHYAFFALRMRYS